MKESLAGNIAEMSVLEIIKLLNSGKKSGRLSVKNINKIGEIYLNSGEIVHCVSGSNIGELAIINIFEWIEGHFNFEDGIQTSEKSIKTPTEKLILKNKQIIDNWQNIKHVISSMDIIFALSSMSSTGAVNLKPEEWLILSQIDGKRTITEIVDVTNKEEYEVAKILYKLHSIGLLEKIKKPSKLISTIIDEKIFHKIEKTLTTFMGPISSIIIDDMINELGESRNSFPNKKIAVLVEKISNEIKQEDKRIQFSQAMIELLKKF